MNLYHEEFAQGVKDLIGLYKQGNNIFEMKGGNLFPTNNSQKIWRYSKAPGHVHFTDGTHTFSFKGDLTDMDSDLEKVEDIPLPDLFNHSTAHGKAQVHRSDPGSMYFTIQEGHNNPTYTLKHMGDSKWKAILKARKVKDKLKEPITPPNVNLEAVKEGMEKELQTFMKEAGGGLPGFFNQALGRGLQTTANLPTDIMGAVGRIGGPIVGPVNDPLNEPMGDWGLHGLESGAIGAGAGGLYHLLKRNLLNTKQENATEDAEGGKLGKRMLLPGLAMAGTNMAVRSALPNFVNDSSLKPFPN